MKESKEKIKQVMISSLNESVSLLSNGDESMQDLVMKALAVMKEIKNGNDVK